VHNYFTISHYCTKLGLSMRVSFSKYGYDYNWTSTSGSKFCKNETLFKFLLSSYSIINIIKHILLLLLCFMQKKQTFLHVFASTLPWSVSDSHKCHVPYSGFSSDRSLCILPALGVCRTCDLLQANTIWQRGWNIPFVIRLLACQDETSVITFVNRTSF
jgi:hypothetical protein